jgi:TraX protein
MHDAARSTSTPHRNPHTPHAVDNTDWLKTAAIILVTVDHFGHFFMNDDRWWSVFGRLAAPSFFFLLGYAQTRTVPLHWIWLGVILTLLNSWNAGWMGGTEHSFEPGTRPPLHAPMCKSSCNVTAGSPSPSSSLHFSRCCR